jgi:serine phosphatase RsbU (regulator of sigma subunit)
MPTIPGWEIDVRWRTARRVGGDFYDCFDLPGNRMGLVIADVSDKGIPAALYMTVARTLIRATAQDGAPPAEVLMRVNELLLMDSKSGMFVTAVYAIVALDSGEMVYSIAGHNLPLWLHQKEGQIEPLAKGGIALGAWDRIQLQNHTIHIDPGDVLLLYTDGVTEAFSPTNDIYGENRLDEVVLRERSGSARQILDAIDTSLVEFLGDAPPSDDITLMAIRRQKPHETTQ